MGTRVVVGIKIGAEVATGIGTEIPTEATVEAGGMIEGDKPWKAKKKGCMFVRTLL